MKSHSDLPSTPIAICGMGVRLPGGIRSASDLFQFLANKGDARKVVPKDRYNVDAYYDPSGKPGTVTTKYGYYLDEDLSRFDASMFRISNAELASMDPGQRMLLEVVREALESAGEVGFRGQNIGTYVGDFTEDWQDLQNIDLLNAAPYQMAGKGDFALANRLSFEYDLQGPSVTIKTACSATAEAVHEAVLAVRSGSCPAAIVAGANIIITPRTSIGMSAVGLLAPDGNCKTFDARADGFARGESVCALYVKRLDLALRDGNPIRAVIRACDANADGGDGSRTFGTPNPATQEKLIRQTYASAGLPLAETKVIEMHGTGTPVGDPLEAAAIANCFGGDKPVYIGSVKPNLGHGEGGSALASIIKSAVALENKKILPNIKFNTPNLKIPWHRNLTVPTETLDWPEGVQERISINSFGLGGSNVHIVLDSASSVSSIEGYGHKLATVNGTANSLRSDATTNTDTNASGTVDGHAKPNTVHHLDDQANGSTNGNRQMSQSNKSLLLLSGNSASSVTQLATNCKAYLERHPDKLEAMAYTLASRRERLKLASYCLADGGTVSDAAAPSENQGVHQVAFVFTGQGAQWVGMGREMLLENAAFAASIRDMDETLKSLAHSPEWTLEETLLADPGVDKDLLGPTDRSQPACTAIQVAYVDALAAWDIRPCAVVGHSSGEIAGAYAAGVLTRREAIIAAYYRGYGCARNETPSGMASVGMGEHDVQPHLRPGVVVACENSKASVTVSGDLEALQETLADIKQKCPHVFQRQLRVPMAYHTPHMEAAASLYRSLLALHLKPANPSVPFYSTVHGRRVDEGEALGPQYWKRNMVSPVLFRTAASRLLADLRAAAHLEIGPHSALAGPLRQIYKEAGSTAPYASVAERGQDSVRAFLASLGKLFCFGLALRMPTSDQAYTLPDLPTYPWLHDTAHWSETRVAASWRFRKHRRHELLGQRVLESSDVEPAWRNILRLGDVPWLADHCVEQDIVFPAAGFVAMAGTAITQLLGGASASAYTVRDVTFAAALLLREDQGVEVATTLRKHVLTTSKDSRWWEFAIASEQPDGTWTRHCWGLVAHGCAGVAMPATDPPDVAPFSRKVDASRWYTALSRIGLNYSNRFVGLEQITASPVRHSASVSIHDRQDDEVYALHPSTLDLVLQSWSVVLAQGTYRDLDRLFLPTFMEQFYVAAEGSRSAMRVRTTSRGPVGEAVANSYGAVVDGGGGRRVAFVLNGLHSTQLEASTAGGRTPELTSLSIQWHPSMAFAPPESMMRPTGNVTAHIQFAEQFGLLCAAEIHEEAATVAARAQPHFQYFLDGVARHMQQVDQGLSLIPDAAELRSLDRPARLETLSLWRHQSKGGPVENSIEAMWRVCRNIRALLEGREALLDILLVGGVLQKTYDESNAWSDVGDFFRVLGLSKPQIRILEIGAGTGSTTSLVLPALHSTAGERLYEEYTITDVSAGFVNQTKERFSQYQNLNFAVCDITVDPVEQGLEAASYDLVIASNVLHATPNLVATLKRCRTLLKPDGQLFLQEFCSNTRYADLIMGLFDGWWAGIEDGRLERPVVQEDVWDAKLRQAGFDGIQAAVRDNHHPHFFNTSNIVARALPSGDTALVHGDAAAPTTVSLLKPNAELSDFGRATKVALEKTGYRLEEYVWGDKLPEDQDIISLMDVDPDRPPLLADIGAQDLVRFIDVVGDVSAQAVLWLMRPAQTPCTDPQQGQMMGVARCVRAELAINFVTLELDQLDDHAGRAVARVWKKVHHDHITATEHDSLDIESEYVWRDGQVLVSRIHSTSVDQALAALAPPAAAHHLVIGQPGLLQTMRWAGHDLPALAPDCVQLRVRVAGLNFHDVAVAMGIVDPDGQMEKDGYHGLGIEGTAVVTAVGAAVPDLAVGDRVVFLEVETACFATEMQLPATLVARAPAGVRDEDAASLIVPYVTVLWCLLEKARMQRGQTLLVHSAAGGVGVAAIHVARWLGLDLYCTVGSPAKADFLVAAHGVPRDRIFHSRDDRFVADVLRATRGAGVDVVLNSLSGELLHASWSCVAAFGCMVDIGKRDALGRARLAMAPFVGNRAFFGIDLASVVLANKHRLVPYVRQAIALVEQGHVALLHPTTVFAADRVQDAFRYMQKGVHMGRIVVRMPQEDAASSAASLPPSLPAPPPRFHPDGVYLLAGGLGGLGRSILSWMAMHGARHVAVLSPSAGTRPEHAEFAEELRELGCELTCFAGDVADDAFVQHVVATLSLPGNGNNNGDGNGNGSGGRTIRGVLQLAMQLRDMGFLNMDHASWSAATRPKVTGTWTLHRRLPRDLDFFVMCGSTSGTLGAYGQANYAAANAFLDAFLHFRRSQGLPASVLDIAAVGDVGYVAVNKNVAERLGRALARFMTEGSFLRSLQLAMAWSAPTRTPAPPAAATRSGTVVFSEPSQIVLYNETALPLSDPRNTTSWRRDPRLAVFRNNHGSSTQDTGAANEGLRGFLASLPAEPERLDDPGTGTFFAEEIARRIFGFLMRDDAAAATIDTSQTLPSMGADSLVAIEIRNWWKQTLGIEITVLELSDAGNTMEALGALAVQRLRQKLAAR